MTWPTPNPITCRGGTAYKLAAERFEKQFMHVDLGCQTLRYASGLLSIADGVVDGDRSGVDKAVVAVGVHFCQVECFTGMVMPPSIMSSLENVSTTIKGLQYTCGLAEGNTRFVYSSGKGRTVRMIFDQGQFTCSSCQNQAARVKKLYDAGLSLGRNPWHTYAKPSPRATATH